MSDMQGDATTAAAPGRLSDRAIQDDPFDYYQQRLSRCPVWHEEDVDLYVIGGLSEAREALMDVESWARMRELHGLSFEEAVSVWKDAVERLLPATPEKA